MTAWTAHEIFNQFDELADFNLLTTDAAPGEALGEAPGEALGRVVGAIDTRAMDLAAVLARTFPA